MIDYHQDNFYDQIINLEYPAKLPESLIEIKQDFEQIKVDDIENTITQEFIGSSILDRIQPGDSIAVAVGSRGIYNLSTIVKTVISIFKQAGAIPFVFPSMGSHGGGTAEGQITLLAELGITPDLIGAEIKATMEVIKIGEISDGPELFMDINSAKADATFLIGRIKPHTDFHAKLESGLSKMCVIGLGKKTGAEAMHKFGSAGFRKFLSTAARIYQQKTNVIGGLGILENAFSETAELRILPIEEIGTEIEVRLLQRARDLMAKLPFNSIDVLVLKEIGKNVSGTGMDTNVVGRMMIPREPEPEDGPDIAVIAVLDLTEESHGNASGIGMANVTTFRFVSKIDWNSTYTNAITTSTFGMQRAALPITMTSDRRALEVMARGCGVSLEKARWVFASNTGKLGTLWVTGNMIDEVNANPRLRITNEVPLSFDLNGNIISPWLLDPITQDLKEGKK